MSDDIACYSTKFAACSDREGLEILFEDGNRFCKLDSDLPLGFRIGLSDVSELNDDEWIRSAWIPDKYLILIISYYNFNHLRVQGFDLRSGGKLERIKLIRPNIFTHVDNATNRKNRRVEEWQDLECIKYQEGHESGGVEIWFRTENEIEYYKID